MQPKIRKPLYIDVMAHVLLMERHPCQEIAFAAEQSYLSRRLKWPAIYFVSARHRESR